jgi:hypothetical protein
MVTNVYNPLWPKLIDTHSSIKNELLIIFKLNKLKIKAFNEFIIDPLSCILQEQRLLYIGGVPKTRKTQIIKAISEFLFLFI